MSVSQIISQLETLSSLSVPHLDPPDIRELERQGYTVLLDMDPVTGATQGFTVERPLVTRSLPKSQVKCSSICAWVLRLTFFVFIASCTAAVICLYMIAVMAEMEFVVHQMNQRSSCENFLCVGCAWRTHGEPLSSFTTRHLSSPESFKLAFWQMCNKCCPKGMY
jgi:hypothetical protein